MVPMGAKPAPLQRPAEVVPDAAAIAVVGEFDETPVVPLGTKPTPLQRPAEVVPNAAAVAVVNELGESLELPRGAINVAKVQFQVGAFSTKMHEIEIERSNRRWRRKSAQQRCSCRDIEVSSTWNRSDREVSAE